MNVRLVRNMLTTDDTDGTLQISEYVTGKHYMIFKKNYMIYRIDGYIGLY